MALDTKHFRRAVNSTRLILIGTILAARWLSLAAAEVQLQATNEWVFKFTGSSDATPAIGVDGTIYFGTFYGEFYAVHPDGTRKWVFKAGREIKSSPAVGADGTIFFGSRDRKCYALNSEGTKKWEFKTGAWVDASPAITRDGGICFGSWDNNFYALDKEGRKLWQFKTDGPVVSSPAIGTNDIIYFGSHDGNFYALKADGNKLWEFKTTKPIVSSPALDWEGHIYFTSGDGYLYALKADGSLQWKLQTRSYREGSPIIGAKGVIFQSTCDRLVAITPEGKLKWDRGVEEMDGSAAVTLDGSVIFGYRGGQIVNYSQERDHRWITSIGPTGMGSPAIAESGTIYIAGEVLHGVVAIQGRSPLARTPWPKFRGNLRNTGNLKDSPVKLGSGND